MSLEKYWPSSQHCIFTSLVKSNAQMKMVMASRSKPHTMARMALRMPDTSSISSFMKRSKRSTRRIRTSRSSRKSRMSVMNRTSESSPAAGITQESPMPMMTSRQSKRFQGSQHQRDLSARMRISISTRNTTLKRESTAPHAGCSSFSAVRASVSTARAMELRKMKNPNNRSARVLWIQYLSPSNLLERLPVSVEPEHSLLNLPLTSHGWAWSSTASSASSSSGGLALLGLLGQRGST
mmetsp:Transcript_99123/g.212385  ORF Transcript_99123/g.212385 Transcript_99123/m.212385 type:complete len:238 (-) Transcript_99123:96-809(-)